MTFNQICHYCLEYVQSFQHPPFPGMQHWSACVVFCNIRKGKVLLGIITNTIGRNCTQWRRSCVAESEECLLCNVYAARCNDDERTSAFVSNHGPCAPPSWAACIPRFPIGGCNWVHSSSRGGLGGEAIAIVGGGAQNALFLYMGGTGAGVGEIAADWKYVGGL